MSSEAQAVRAARDSRWRTALRAALAGTAEPVLASRRWVLVAAAIGALLVASQLPFASLRLDDFFIRLTLRGGPDRHFPAWDLFHFFSEDGGGMFRTPGWAMTPWFVDQHVKVAFLRPLSSLIFAFDDAVFGDYAPAYLLHGGLWYVALCALVAVWYQKHLPGLSGGLAAVLFALMGCHQEVISWFSARNALVAALFGMLALLAHERWRERGQGRYRAAALVALGLSMAAGEAGLGAAALLCGLDIARSGPRWRVARDLWPVAALGLAYMGLYTALGYGTRASGAYINPLSEPLNYLTALPIRLAVSVGVLFAGVPSLLWFLAPHTRTALGLIGLGVGTVGALWLFRAARRWDERERSFCLQLCFAVPCALLPQMAGLLGGRSYVIASIASAGLLGMLIESALRSPAQARIQRIAIRGAGVLLLSIHTLGALWSWRATTVLFEKLESSLVQRQAELGLDRAGVEQDTFLVLSVPDAFVGLYLSTIRRLSNLAMPAWHLLSMAERDHEVVRTGDHSFELRVLDGDILHSSFAEIFRRPSTPLPVGTRVDLDSVSARVLAVSERGQPTRVEFTARRPLADSHLKLFAWNRGRMQELVLEPGVPTLLHWERLF